MTWMTCVPGGEVSPRTSFVAVCVCLLAADTGWPTGHSKTTPHLQSAARRGAVSNPSAGALPNASHRRPSSSGLGASPVRECVCEGRRLSSAPVRYPERTLTAPPSVHRCSAVCRDPRWGRCYESYSEDHTIVQQMTDIIPGLQGEIPVMVPYNYTKYIDDLTSLVHKGIVDMSRIDDAVRRILRVKFMMGLFENPLSDLSFADQLGKKVGTTILDAIKSTVADSTPVVYSENPDGSFMKHNDFSFAIVVVGELPYSETVGDSTDLTIIDPGPDTIRTVCSAVKCVVVIISGRPVVIEPYVPLMEALVAAWLPGTEGQGVADVLFGDYGFTGKLPRTWFKSVDQLPMNVGDPHYDPLYPFGFGLTINSSLPGFSGVDNLGDTKQRVIYAVLCSLLALILIDDLGIGVFQHPAARM
ncbi:beta-glucosidase BoGH3B-like [Panicum miliaceum]|uniref:beta-glucosidase n=1 Tax=Panicum miliaceum TaxID=4540 RepID=A0A3L6SK24_PANMI|nr:beta-glucosidase BoGH3B-like [Panicum miliaceum]